MRQPSRPRVEVSAAGTVRFLGVQDGGSEREFMKMLAPTLRADCAVLRGYLARVAYGSSLEVGVALCLVTNHHQEALMTKVAQVFSSMFGTHESLDIMFIDASQEEELAKVCSPFFESST